MDVMKMGNIVPRAGIETTSLTFSVSVLTITPLSFPNVTSLPMSTCLCGSLPERSVQNYYTHPSRIVSLKCLQLHTGRDQGRFNNHTVISLYWIMVMTTSVMGVMGVMKMGNIVPTAGIEPTSLAFRVSVLYTT